MGRLAKGPFPPELWDWAMSQIPRIAAKCERSFRQDLEAHLAIKLLQISRNLNLRADDWKKYVYVSLTNHAISLAKVWLKRRSRETAFDAYPEIPAQDEGHSADLERVLELVEIRRFIPACCFEYLQQLDACGGNVSLLARKRGKHRNTIHRHLNKIRQGKCPCEIESGTRSLLRLAQSPSASRRQARRAMVVLALLKGQSYLETISALHVSSAIIARWVPRFRRQGIQGIKANYHGRKPSQGRVHLVDWLRAPGNSSGLSVRELARTFGICKSTVQLVLKQELVHLINKKTL